MRWLAVLIVAAGLTGCGPDCQSSCQRLYSVEGECQMSIPGESPDESFRTCIKGCEAALDHVGPIGGYDPFEQETEGASIRLENEKQAALWMECVDVTSCQDIARGFCAPKYPQP